MTERELICLTYFADKMEANAARSMKLSSDR